jgi:hypothetical protein
MPRTNDYVVGRVLPYMHHTPVSVDALVRDFTVDEARQLCDGRVLDQLPVMMNHNDGTTDERTGHVRKLDRVGTVHGMAVHGVDARVLLAIDPHGTHSNTYSSNAVAQGIYGGISLGNRVDSKSSADTGRTVLIKTPTEVSLCKVGRRHGSTIEHFMPCRETCERLLAAEPKLLTDMASRFDYADELQRQGLDVSRGPQYIDGLVALADQRLARIQAANHLQLPAHAQQPQPQQISLHVRASMSAETDASAVAKQMFDASLQQQQQQAAQPMETDAVAPAAGGAAVAQPPPPVAAVQEPVARSVVTEVPDAPDVRDAKAMAAEALKSKEEAVELRRQLAEAQQAQLELAGIREAERKKKEEEFQTIVRSYIENAQKAKMGDQEIQQTVGCAQDLFKEKPDSAMGLIKSSLAMSVRASQQTSNLESLQAQQLTAHVNAQNNAEFDQMALRMSALREQERSFTLTAPMAAGTTVPVTALSTAQVATLAPPAAVKQEPEQHFSSSSSSSSSFDKRFAAVSQPAALEPAAPAAVETPIAPYFVRASESDPGQNDYDALAQFKQQVKLLGRIPSIRDVSYGVAVQHTGQMKASASGEQVPVTRLVPLRRTPAAVEPANFAPEWHATLMRAMDERSNKNVRYLGRDAVKCTHVGSGYNT